MDAQAVASTSQVPYQVYNPAPRWISSAAFDDAAVEDEVEGDDEGVAAAALSATRFKHRGLGAFDRQYDVIGPTGGYMPTTRRRGKMRFVRPAAAGGTLGGDLVGEFKMASLDGPVKEEDVDEQVSVTVPALVPPSGWAVRSLYDLIARKGSSTPTPATEAAVPPSLEPEQELLLEDEEDDIFSGADVVVIDDDSDSSTGSDSSRAPSPPPDELDFVILDPFSRERISTDVSGRSSRALTPLPPRGIHALLPASFDPSSSGAVVAPIRYAIKSTSVGYRILSNLGWKEGLPLGLDEIKGLKVPLKASDKKDRKGLGNAVAKKVVPLRDALQALERERKEGARDELKRRGKGQRGMHRVQSSEARERQAMIAYMNR